MSEQITELEAVDKSRILRGLREYSLSLREDLSRPQLDHEDYEDFCDEIKAVEKLIDRFQRDLFQELND